MKNKEFLIEKGLFSISIFMIIVAILLVSFTLVESVPFFIDYNFLDFIWGTKWSPDMHYFGIFPMIVSSLIITVLSLIIAVPLSISCAIFLEEIAPIKIKLIFKPIIQTLAGIPSVVYGFFGLTLLVPAMRHFFGGTGFSVLTASFILAIMILPTIITVAQDSINSVPIQLKEASLGLGSTHFQAIKNIIIPNALPGIFTAIVLGFSRAIGETLAVLLVIGNVSLIPNSLFDPARTLTSNIALEMSYASGIHYHSLFATAIILFMIIMILIMVLNKFKSNLEVFS